MLVDRLVLKITITESGSCNSAQSTDNFAVLFIFSEYFSFHVSIVTDKLEVSRGGFDY